MAKNQKNVWANNTEETTLERFLNFKIKTFYFKLTIQNCSLSPYNMMQIWEIRNLFYCAYGLVKNEMGSK